MYRELLWFFFPVLAKLLNISIIDPEVMGFFRNAIRTIIEKRSNDKIAHHDFLQLIVDAQKKKCIDDDGDDEKDIETHHGSESDVKSNVITRKLTDIEITENDIIATSIVFFLAGYETTASTLSFLFYSLAIYPEHQETLYEEILKYESKGPIDYDAIAR